jgi:hypothetical protein
VRDTALDFQILDVYTDHKVHKIYWILPRRKALVRAPFFIYTKLKYPRLI